MSKTPRAFRLDPDAPADPAGKDPVAQASRSTVEDDSIRETLLPDGSLLIEEPDAPEPEEPATASARRRSRGWPWISVLLSSLGGLAVLWLMLGVQGLIERLLVSTPALGWTALALAIAALLAFCAIVLRELRGILRERRIEALHKRAQAAIDANDEREAMAIARDVMKLYSSRPEMEKARSILAASDEDSIIDAGDRLGMVERELLTPLDKAARGIVANQAKQVSIVTALSPRAIVDVAFVLYACMRLVRQIAALYGGRPGFLGFMRLLGNVLAHLAVTSGLAVGDGLLQQIMGLGLAARVSAKMGEGVLNGLLTARVGLAAIAVCRPLPFNASEPPRFTDIAAGLLDKGSTSAT